LQQQRRRRTHFGIFRTRNACNAKRDRRLGADHIDWQCRQGDYNLSLAVDPTDHNNVATGMVDFYLSQRTRRRETPLAARDGLGAVRPRPRAHGDHHAAVFALQPGPPPAPAGAWVANDGISRCLDWVPARPSGGGARRSVSGCRPLCPPV
jgi:hypothetical protein